LKFVMFSDVHENYDEMSGAIASINNLPDISFILCGGDVTNSGLSREFEWYAEIMKESHYPLITVIGNHDCMANGLTIFNRMFGPPNISWRVGRYKFILFNRVIWENHNRSPDYEWLREEVNDTSSINILASHVPPQSEDIGSLHRIIYDQIVDSTKIILNLHSSAHKYFEYFRNGIHTLITTEIKDREFYIIKIFGRETLIERYNF